MPYKIRAHQKTRSGCNNCKIRRVKCDENKPQCEGCQRRGVECIYRSITKRTANPTISSAGCEISKEGNDTSLPLDTQQDTKVTYDSSRRLLDLRLMHQYCVFTTQYFASTFPEEVSVSLKVDIPQLAFRHEFLMDAVLLVAVVHLGCNDSAMIETLPVCLYRNRALSSLRKAVAQVTSNNIDAIRGASVLIATVSFAADRISGESGLWVVNWLALAFGQRNFRSPWATPAVSPGPSQEDNLPRLSLYGSFDDIVASTTIPSSILRALVEHQDTVDETERGVLRHAAGELGRLISALWHPYEQPWLEKKIKAWAFDVVSPEFLKLAREGNPHAFIILAHYLILFRLLPDLWVYEGLVNHDIVTISQMLAPMWQPYIAVPQIALQTAEGPAMVALLVSCLEHKEKANQFPTD